MIESLTYLFARLIKKARLSAVKNSQIHRTAAIESGSQIVGSAFGRHSYCGYDCTILNTRIGGFCSISDNVVIGGSQHPMHYVSTSPVFLAHRDSVKTKFSRHSYENKPVTHIGNDVWIGNGAKIKAGICIGTGAVIGMGSVVVKDVPAYGVFGGNPAKLIRFRFEESQIDALLKGEWWNGDDASLKKMGTVCDDLEKFLSSGEYDL